MIAQVIVDVPSRQTDRPFDYVIPAPLENWVEMGSRVAVPFGNRLLQGFVIAIHATSERELHQLRAIEEVLDVEPPLTADLVALGRWMAKTYACPEIIALQSMLPGALRAVYKKWIVPVENYAETPEIENLVREEEAMLTWIRKQQPVLLEELLRQFPTRTAMLKKLMTAGVVAQRQEVKNKGSRKKALTVFVSAPKPDMEQALAQLGKKAFRQREVMDYLLANPEPIPVAQLLHRIGAASTTIKSLADKGLIDIRESESLRDPYRDRQFAPTSPLALTTEQDRVFRAIDAALHVGKYRRFLLHGVTGSGKTEIYLQAIKRCLDNGKSAIVLVPEISLTPQMVERFKGRFGHVVAVIHSRLSQGERYDEWRRIRSGDARVVVGARSAVFAPFTELGLIIIDEEHETSYKQEESPKYHARDVAYRRAKAMNAVVVLGSATPSLESYVSAAEESESSLTLLTMDQRVMNRPLPAVRIVDMKEELRDGNRSMFSRLLFQMMEERLERDEQMVLLLNRRGFSTFVMCRSCGYVLQCPHCDISMTYHRNKALIRCHYCGHAEKEPTVCPECQSEHIRYFGTGTQKVEEELYKCLPGVRVIRMDVDTTTEKGSHEKWLNQFRDRKADILLGTQMVAKGLDFPNVTLVGVIAADTVLHLPDFRAAEKTFQLLTQVAGRAGRHDLAGEVVIQTYHPDHYSIECAGRHHYRDFANQELLHRRAGKYPPYCRLLQIIFSHEQVQVLVRTGDMLAKRLADKLAEQSRQMPERPNSLWHEMLGPVACPIPRIKDRYRFQLMIKYRGGRGMVACALDAVRDLEDWVKQTKVLIQLDVDPQVMM